MGRALKKNADMWAHVHFLLTHYYLAPLTTTTTTTPCHHLYVLLLTTYYSPCGRTQTFMVPVADSSLPWPRCLGAVCVTSVVVPSSVAGFAQAVEGILRL